MSLSIISKTGYFAFKVILLFTILTYGDAPAFTVFITVSDHPVSLMTDTASKPNTHVAEMKDQNKRTGYFQHEIAIAIISGIFLLLGGVIGASAAIFSALIQLREKRKTESIEYKRRMKESQIFPYIESLDSAISKSDAVSIIPDHIRLFGSKIPQLRRHVDKVVLEWSEAMRELSDNKIQMLLALDQKRVKDIAKSHSEFVHLAHEMLKIRDKHWFEPVPDELKNVHTKYVVIGYSLILDLKEAVSESNVDEDSSTSDLGVLIEELAQVSSLGSVVAIPYGSVVDYVWLSIWFFYEDEANSYDNACEKALTALTRDINSSHSALSCKMSRASGTPSYKVYCISATFSSEERLSQFVHNELPNYRQQYSILWIDDNVPNEIRIGLDSSL